MKTETSNIQHPRSNIQLRTGPGVHRLLVTGENKALLDFHGEVCLLVNAIERRGHTIFYTVMGEDLEVVVEFARHCRVTVQQHVSEEPYWPVVVKGPAAAWEPEAAAESRKPKAESRRKSEV